MTHWWRAYDHSVDNAKLQKLPGDLFKAWYNLCCLASANAGILPRLTDIAFKLRVSESKARNVVETLQRWRLVDEEGGVLRMHDWDEYQYKSDISTGRVKQFREREKKRCRNDAGNGDETFHETDGNSSEKRNGSVSVFLSSEDSLSLEEPQREQASGRKRKPKTQLPDDFEPDRDFPRIEYGWSQERITQQIEAFKDSARQHRREYADWPAAWRNWCRSPFQKQTETPKFQGGIEGII